jgi:tetratricopeptide (TPR) repeat protein
MTRSLTIALTALALTGCTSLSHRASFHHRGGADPYEGKIFYTKYLNPKANPLDARIQRDLDQLRANPNAASIHNDLGSALVEKGFPKDAEVEFERAVNADSTFYPAWYNLGLVRESLGDLSGARVAYHRTVQHKPGHASALFQLGLISEKNGNVSEAINYYAKAFLINHHLLDVRVNPRILDSRLVDVALIKAYPDEHARESTRFEGAPSGYVETQYPVPIAPTDSTKVQSPAPPPPAPATTTPAPTPPGKHQ